MLHTNNLDKYNTKIQISITTTFHILEICFAQSVLALPQAAQLSIHFSGKSVELHLRDGAD